MKRKIYSLLVSAMLLLSLSAMGQKTVVVVQPDAGIDIGALNSAITSATDPGNTIFELKRGGHYYLNGSISHSGYTLHIRAEAGTGIRPVLQPAADDLGNSSRHFNPGGDLILEGLYIQGRGELGAVESQPIRVSGADSRIIIDDCFLDYAGQSMVRLNSSGNKVYIKNSILRNSLLADNPANGRIIDTRGNPQDTLSVENSTIYNCGATLVRTDGAFTHMVIFNHNTVFQTAFQHNIALDIVLKANFTNNLFYNFCYRADPTTHQALFSIDSMFTIGEFSDADRVFDFSNNNWYTQEEIGDVMEEFGSDTLYRFNSWDTERLDTIRFKYTVRTNVFANQAILDTAVRTLPPRILHFIANGQVDTSNIFSESLRFTNAPPLNLDYWKFFVENNYSISGTNPPSPFADEDPLVLGEVTTGAYNFSYNDNSRSATAATGGLPLGASRWVPYTTVAVRDITVTPAWAVRAYPNPFSDKVTFEVESLESSSVRIIVLNLIGKEVISVNKNVSPGKNEITLDFSRISHSGIYLYQVQSELKSGQKLISSGKIVKR